MDLNQRPGTSKSTPLQIPEILEHVMQYVKPADLLRCRLVNKQWSIEARKQLTQKIYFNFNNMALDFCYHENDSEFLHLMRPDSERGRPLFQSFKILTYSTLTSPTMASIGGQIRQLVFEGHETYISKAVRRIIVICPNLEYLNVTTRADFASQLVLSSLDRHVPAPGTARLYLLKLKILVMKFVHYLPSVGHLYHKLVLDILDASPNLERLHIPSISTKQTAPEVMSALLEQVPSLVALRSLSIGYQLDNQADLAGLLKKSAKLITLRLNETWTDIFPIIARYQPGLECLQCSIRNFQWTDLQNINNFLALHPTGLGSLLKLKLLDMSNINHCNQILICIEQDDRGDTRERERERERDRVASYYGIKSCTTSSRYFLWNLRSYMFAEPALINTIAIINLGNVPASVTSILFLAQFRGLTKLEILPKYPAALRRIWMALTRLQELVIHVHPSLYPGVILESTITGLPYELSRERSSEPIGLVDGRWVLSTQYAQSNDVCICELTELRKLELRNESPAYIHLTKRSVYSCFLKMKSLTCLKIPYRDIDYPIRFLQQISPALDLEIT